MDSILEQLYKERDRIDRTIEAYMGKGTTAPRERVMKETVPAGPIRKRKKPHVSAETRRRIAESQRKRWDRARAAEMAEQGVTRIEESPQTPEVQAFEQTNGGEPVHVVESPQGPAPQEPTPEPSQTNGEGHLTPAYGNKKRKKRAG